MDPGNQSPPDDENSEPLEGSSTVVEPTSNEPGQPAQPTSPPPAQPPGRAPVPGSTPALESSTIPGASLAPEPGTTPTPDTPPPKPPRPPVGDLLKRFFGRFSVYFLIFGLVLIVSIVILVLTLTKNQKSNNPNIPTKNLTASQLEQLATSSQTVGSSNEVLNIGSDTIINGQLLVKKDLDVAGSVKIGGTLTLPGITVPGPSSFTQLSIGKLAVSGDSALQGSLVINKNLTVSGSSNLNGAVSINQLSVQTLQLSGTLDLNHHISAGGTTPNHSSGGAVGNGGTTSLNGSDTAGTITINTGTGAGAGCFIYVTFAQAFASTPHVVVSPVGSGAAGLYYYVNRTTTSFSICTTNTPPSGSSFGFDYIVFD